MEEGLARDRARVTGYRTNRSMGRWSRDIVSLGEDTVMISSDVCIALVLGAGTLVTLGILTTVALVGKT